MRSIHLLTLACFLTGCALSGPNVSPGAGGYMQNGVITLPDGAQYRGDLRNGLLHGRGELTWPNGATYVGDFENGLLHGRGTMTEANGARYEASYHNGMLNGHGTLVTSDGERYEGEFVDDELAGQGTYWFRNRDKYVGQFSNNKADGEGLFIYANGTVYNGRLRDWRFDGPGMLATDQGTYYEGEFGDGNFHGEGEFVAQSGVRYIGEYREGDLNGHGVIHYGQGVVYSGEVINWQPQGWGVMVLPNGAWYVGEFQDARYYGQGTFYYDNGDVHVGQFEDGLFHGAGTLHYLAPKGRKPTLVGKWEYGRYVSEDEEQLAGRSEGDNTPKVDTEWVLFNQHHYLNDHLARLRQSRAGEVDMYFLSFGSYAEQDVFMKEVLYTEKLFRENFHADGYTVSMINNPATAERYPLASETNLRLALDALAKSMNTDEDVLFMYLTGHGSKKRGLSVSFGDAPFRDLSPDTLDRLLDDAGIKWRVIVVSACYSGGFIEQLKDANTMIMTSARADHVSFGCSDDADFTFFGRALFANALANPSVHFEEAFHKAKMLIDEWENEENYDHSDPQIYVGERIETQLGEWRERLSARAKEAGVQARSDAPIRGQTVN